MGNKLAIFDMDGVLLDTLTQHLKFCEDMNDKYKLNLSIPNEKSFKDDYVKKGVVISPMLDFFLALGFPPVKATLCENEYKESFHQKELNLFSGVDEMLQIFSDQRILLGLVTANNRNVFEDKFNKDLFSISFCKDDTEDKREALEECIKRLELEKSNCCYIGDQIKDYEAARDAEIQFLGVTYGWGLSDGDFPIVDSITSLTTWIQNWVSKPPD